MSKQQKPPTKSAAPQGEVPPDSGALAGFKQWNHQSGANANAGDVPHRGERYEGDSASQAAPSGTAPRFQLKNDMARKRGPAPKSEANTVPGSDAQPGNIGLSK